MSRGYFDCVCCNALVCGGVKDSSLCDVCRFKQCDPSDDDGCFCRECMVDGCHGIYVPQEFITRVDNEKWGISKDDAAVLAKGPESEEFDEVWDDVLNSAEWTDPDGSKWGLEQDGDLFAVCVAPPEGFEVGE